MTEDKIPVLRKLTKNELLKLLECYSTNGSLNYQTYQRQLNDAIITRMGFTDIKKFRQQKIFSYDDCVKIQAYFKFSDEEIKAIRK